MTKESFDIVYFGNDWFGENRTSSHHIAERLSNNNRVLYIECPGMRMPQGNKRDLKKLFVKIKRSLSPPQKINNNFYIYTLFQLPLHKIRVIRFINRIMIPIIMNFIIKFTDYKNPLLWFHLPHLTMVPGKIKSRGVIYYCIDNYSALPGVVKNIIFSMDEEMTRLADIVFVSSIPLLEEKKDKCKQIIYSPHGVDFNHFNRINLDSLPLPSDAPCGNSGPIIGFWGLMEGRIDLSLIRYLSERNPSWIFLLIGHVALGGNPCEELENVHFLGPKSFQSLPAYAQTFDVTILPYKQDDFFLNCNPLKLREFLATGKPVVAMRNPEIERYSDVVEIADDFESFEAKLHNVLKTDNAQKAITRINKVKEESWDSRVEQIICQIKHHFNVER